jgi:integrase
MKKSKMEVSPKPKLKWHKTRYQGVYYRISQGEKTHDGKPDRCFFIRYKKEGKRIMEKVGWAGDEEGYSAETAREIRANRIKSIRHGEELPKEKAKIPHFSEVWKTYKEWAEGNKARGGIDDQYLYEKHLKGRLGKKRLNEISSFDLERLKAEIVKKGLSAATVKHCLVLVRQIFNKAIAWKKFQGPNPIKGVKLPTVNNRRERFLTHEEAGKLLAELKKTSEEVHDMALISLHAGLRFGEIADLRGQDLDFLNGIMSIADPKNKTARKAFMTPEVKAALKERFPENQEDLIFSDRWHGETQKQPSKTFQRAADRLFNQGVTDRLQRVVFHSLRHSFGSWLAMAGVPLITIKELMGHKSLAMTERYAHLLPDLKKQAALNLADIFRESLIKQAEKEKQAQNASEEQAIA